MESTALISNGNQNDLQSPASNANSAGPGGGTASKEDPEFETLNPSPGHSNENRHQQSGANKKEDNRQEAGEIKEDWENNAEDRVEESAAEVPDYQKKLQ